MPTIALILCSAALQHDPSVLSRRALLSGTAAALSSPILPAFAFGETDYSGGSATGSSPQRTLPPPAKRRLWGKPYDEEFPGMDPEELDAAIRDDACFPGDLGYESWEASGRFS